MKNAVVVFVSGTLGCLTLLFIMMISGRMNRSMEAQSQLPAAMEMTVEQMMQQERTYAVGEVTAECMECIAAAADTDSDFTVEVYQEDIGKGGLAIRMMEEFSYPNGSTGLAECQRMVIYNCVQGQEQANYVVRFYESREKMQSGGSCYKAYTVKEGECMVQPTAPTVSGLRFAGWKDANDYIADFSLPVEQNRSYYAEWE